MQGSLDEAALLDFEVDFDLGDLLKASDPSRVRDSSTKISVEDLGRNAGLLDEVFPPVSAHRSLSSLKNNLPLCSSHTASEHSHVQKKARMCNAAEILKDPCGFDLDWEVDTPRIPSFAATQHQTEIFPLQETGELRNEPEERRLHMKGIIPGPAGAVQTGKSANRGVDSSSRPQDQRSKASDDRSFKSTPWLKALQYFRLSEVDPVQYAKRDLTISHIKSSPELSRIPQLIAIVKTCTPNGCGDAFVTLQDPTGTISGTVHRRLLAETEFGRDFVPGAVVLLCKVAVFRPSPRAQYLNITMNNVLQVFREH